MERKNWLWAMAGMGLLMPGLAQALGLGSLRVLSAPGEPFRAEIPIQSVTPQTASSINASLAPNSAFAVINLPQAPALEHWQVTVRRGSQPAILISSPLPVSQPNLQFLVQLNWSGGRLVREYSASVANAAAAMPPVSSAAPVVPSAISPARVSATESVAQPPAPARLYHGWSRVNRYGPVPVNSSLFDIAQSITNSNAVTLDQVMSAVVKANPQAFKNANPTYLYAGSMLNLPNVNQVQAMTPAQATAWLSTQSQAGTVASPPATQTSRAAASTSTPQKASTIPTESATHLVLSSAPANAVAASAETASATSSPLAVDTLALQTETQKLKSEVTGLGQRLSAEERLLANQGVQLATLSRNSANNSLLNNIPLLISLGGNLLLLILFIWMLRRQKESERRQREVSQRLSTLNSSKSKPVAEPPVVAPAPAAAAAAAYSAGVEPAITSPAVSTPAPVTTPASKEAVVEEIVPVAEQAPAQTQTEDHDDRMEIDPIGQADLYLTYGKSEQAITVMHEALDENPRRKELYVKLLDMYATLDRRSDYLELAERMRGRFGPHNAAWQEVAVQGSRLFPGNALFASEDEREADVMAKRAPGETPADKVQEAPATEHDADDMLDFDFSHGQVAPAAAADDSFPADEKARLLQDIGEQFRLMDADHLHAEQTTDEVDSASHEPITAPEAPKAEATSAEDTLPFSFGLSPFDEEQAPAVPAREPDPEPEALREMPKPAIVEETSPAAEDWDAVGTKLDLAKAYIEMGDSESARDLLEEVSKEGSSAQREEAQKMLEDL